MQILSFFYIGMPQALLGLEAGFFSDLLNFLYLCIKVVHSVGFCNSLISIAKMR